MGRWVVVGGDAVQKNERQRFSRDDVEQTIAKALKAAGVDPTSIRPTVDRLLSSRPKTLAKSALQIERERVERQHALEADMERDRVERLRKAEQRRRDLERSRAHSADVARAAVTFVEAGTESTAEVEGAVTRLDLSQQVAKRQRHGLFGDIVEAEPTEPFRG